MRRIFSAIGFLCCLSALGVQAEISKGSATNPINLSDSIVVTANRQLTPLREIGSSISVITAKQIASSQAGTVAEILRSVPSVDVVQSGGPGKTTSVFLRGANSHHTLVLIDGIKMNDPSTANGSFDFANVDLSNVERIEVLRGSQSVLYGSDAIGGVIQIITKGAAVTPQFEISLEGGSYRELNESIRYSGRTDRVNYSIALGHKATDGFTATSPRFGSSETDGFESTEFSGQAVVDLSDGYLLSLVGRNMEAKSDIDQADGFVLDDYNYTNETSTATGSVKITRQKSGSQWTPSIEFSRLNQDYLATDPVDAFHPDISSSYHSEGSRTVIATQHLLSLAENARITLGAETEEATYSSEYASVSAWGESSDIVGEKRARTTSGYFQGEYARWDRSFLTAGIRLDDHDQFGSQFTFRVTEAFLVKPLRLKLKASVGTGFKAPSLSQLFHPSWGNPNLKAEESRSFDIGLEQQIGLSGVSISLTYFDNKYKNLIGSDPVTYLPINIDEAKSHGLEAMAQWRYAKTDLQINYTQTTTKNITSSALILRRPESKFSANLSQRLNDQAGLNLTLLYVGDRSDMDFINFQNVSLASYTLLNIGVDYSPYSWLRLRSQLHNLLDEEYEEVHSYTTSGRAVKFGLDINLR